MVDASAAMVAVTVAKLVLRASEKSDVADGIDDVAGVVASAGFVRRMRRVPFYREISDGLQGLRAGEFPGVAENDWEAAAWEVADLLERHGDRLDSVVDAEAFLASIDEVVQARRRGLGSEPAQGVFDHLLRFAVGRVAQATQASPSFQRDATVRLLRASADLASAVSCTAQQQAAVVEGVGRLLAGAEFAMCPLSVFVHRRMATDPSLRSVAQVGREGELTQIADWALDGPGDRVVVVTAPGGRGKTRLCTEALLRVAEQSPELPVWVIDSPVSITGHVLQRLAGPCVVFLDDAHLHLDQVKQLVACLIDNPDMRLLLGTRPQAVPQIERCVLGDSGGATRVVRVDVDQLDIDEARSFVDALLLGAPYEPSARFRMWLVREAQREPYLPVYAIDLFCRGALEGPIAVNKDLRTLVLSRYMDERLPTVDGVPRTQVQRLLAALHLLSGSPSSDATVAASFEFAGIPIALRPALLVELEASGLLERLNGRLDVVPEIVGDACLEVESGSGQPDLVDQMWRQLGPHGGWPAFLRVCALDWRLTHQGRPSVIGPVWPALTDHLAAAAWWQTADVLSTLGALTQLQPHRFAQVLFAVITRVEDERAARHEDKTSPPAASTAVAELSSGSDASTVACAAVPLLCECAQDPSVPTSQVLDAVWGVATAPDIGSTQATSVMQAVTDKLATVTRDRGTYETSGQVAAWVRDIATTAAPEHLPLLVPVCATIMAKTSRFHEMVDPTRLSWGDIPLSASDARAARDNLRAAIRDTIGDMAPETACEVLGMLAESAQRATRGLSHSDPRAVEEYEQSWCDDDLATLDLLADVLPCATPAVRRLTRRKLAPVTRWPGAPRVGLRALEVITELDEMPQDDWAQMVLAAGGFRFDLRLAHRRGVPLPTLEDFQESQQAADLDRLDYDDLKDRAEADMRAAATRLLEAGVDAGLKALGEAAIDMAAAGQAATGLQLLWRSVATMASPEQAAAIVRVVADRADGLLDGGLAAVMAKWLENAPESYFTWQEDHLTHSRPSTRVEIAAVLRLDHQADSRRQEALTRFLDDGNQSVRDQAVFTLADSITTSPGDTLTRLAAAHPSDWAAHAVLQPLMPQLASWIDGLDAAGRASAMTLLESTGLTTPNLVSLAVAVLKHDPQRVIAICQASQDRYRDSIDTELITALGNYPDELLAHAFDDDPFSAAGLIGRALHLPLPTPSRERFVRRLATLDTAKSVLALRALSEISSWPLFDPDLALAIWNEANDRTPADRDEIRGTIRNAMFPTFWSIDDERRSSEELKPIAAQVTAVLEQPIYSPLHTNAHTVLDYINTLTTRP